MNFNVVEGFEYYHYLIIHHYYIGRVEHENFSSFEWYLKK